MNKNSMRISPRLGGYINLCRWVAALLVCVSHLRDFIFVAFENIIDPGTFDYFAFFLTNLGHQSVIVFFVLSGFLVGGNAILDFQMNRFSWGSYFLNRFTRLYTVLIACLILGGLFDYIGMTWFDKFGAYSGGKFQSLNFNVSTACNAKVFVGNLLFLQTIFVAPFGSNGPLWSLANEFWYYLMCPLLLIPFFAKENKYKQLGSIAIFIICTLIVGQSIMAYFPLWLWGLLLRLSLKKQWHFSFSHFFVAIFLFSLATTISRLSLLKKIGIEDYVVLQDYLIAITFGPTMLILNGLPTGFCQSFLEDRKHFYLSGFSYSLYALHYPFLLCALSCFYTLTGSGLKMQPDLLSWVIFAVALVVCYLFSFAISLLTENKTTFIRNRLSCFLGLTQN